MKSGSWSYFAQNVDGTTITGHHSVLENGISDVPAGGGGGSGSYSGHVTFMQDLTQGTTQMSSFCQGNGNYETPSTDSRTSNIVSFLGPTCSLTLGGGVQLFLPHTWVPGTSISHVDPTANPNDLMIPSLPEGIPIQEPSVMDLAILSDLGWTNITPVSTSDYITLNDPSGSCTGTPVITLDFGSTYHYCLNGNISPNPASTVWELRLFATDGQVTVATQTTGWTWTMTMPSAPSGHIWERDVNGRIKGILKVSGTATSTSWPYGLESLSSAYDVGVNFEPQNLQISVKNASTYWCQCDKETVYFYAPGASYYLVSKRAQFFSSYWSGWSTPVVVHGNQHTFNSLCQYDNYEFQVQAVNSLGTLTSNIVGRNRCANYVLIAPNPISISAAPTFNVFVNNYGGGTVSNPVDKTDNDCSTDASISDALLGMDNVESTLQAVPADPCAPTASFLISNVTLTNVANSDVVYTLSYDGSASNVQINAQNFLPGIYAVNITSTAGVLASTTIEIDQ